MECEVNKTVYVSKYIGGSRIGDCVGCIAEKNDELCKSLDDCVEGRKDIIWVEK